MPERISDFLRSLKSDDLNAVLDADMKDLGVEDTTTVIDLVQDGYPELLDFLYDCYSRSDEFDGLTEEQRSIVLMFGITALGTICRVAEIHDVTTGLSG